MKERTLSEKITSVIEKIRYEGLPPRVIRKVKSCILDLFGAYFAGYDLKSCDPIKKHVESIHGPEQSTVWGMKTRTGFIEAAFANSAMSHVTVFDDMHAKTASHYGSMIIPAALAIGECFGC